jgi:hypothetical protein
MEEDIKKFQKYNKLNLYKDGLIKFINSQIEQDKWIKVKHNLKNNLNNLDYIIGILFLTEMNRNCKNNNISIHGYYITIALINLFSNIKNKLLRGKKISNETIIFLFNNIANNIDYLNTRVNNNNLIKKKINDNLPNLLIELTPLLNELIYYKKKHNNVKNIDNALIGGFLEINTEFDIVNNIEFQGCCNKNCYNCWVDEILTKFIYILLIIAKFMGTGTVKEPNLYKLAEYYSNIFYTLLKQDSINYYYNNETKNDLINIYQNLFTNYQDYKTKLIYSNMELGINSDTIDEIINYLDNEIINRFLEKKISIN